MNILKKGVTKGKDAGESTVAEGVSPFAGFCAKFFSSALFVGYVPYAQGTFGSLWIPLLFMALPGAWFADYIAVSYVLAAAAVVLYFIGVWAAGVSEIFWGHDPGRVVIDEVVGMIVAILFVPLSLTTVWIGFILFRVFDIFKPPPVRNVEKFSRGWGVMNDDVVAGIYANIVLRIILALL